MSTSQPGDTGYEVVMQVGLEMIWLNLLLIPFFFSYHCCFLQAIYHYLFFSPNYGLPAGQETRLMSCTAEVLVFYQPVLFSSA
mmetsp:Transcript_34073/g.53259  ORF Transcript_34073/g.53259 Transcript_34073/m.53259 type:complete len:83 (-) Transcript_34073:530-778(-)